jgi:hypothetical protein
MITEDKIDMSSNSNTVKDVIWSRSVQLGPDSYLYNRVLQKTINDLPGVDTNSYELEKAFIINTYAESSRMNAQGQLVYFTKSPDLKGSLEERFNDERASALALLDKEWGKT